MEPEDSELPRSGGRRRAPGALSVERAVLVIPAHNEAKRVAAALESAGTARQPEGFGWAKWLVVSDGSTDDTVEVAAHWAAEHPETPVEVLATEARAGKGAALNLAQAALSHLDGGTVVVYLDADSRVAPWAWEALLPPFLADPALDIAWGVSLPDRGGWGRLAGAFQLRAVAAMAQAQPRHVVRAHGRLYAARLRSLAGFTYRPGLLSQDLQISAHAAASGMRSLVVPDAVVLATPPAGYRQLYLQTYRGRRAAERVNQEWPGRPFKPQRLAAARAFVGTALRHPVGAAAYLVAMAVAAVMDRVAPVQPSDTWILTPSTRD